MTGGDLKEIKPPRSSLLSGTSTSLENLKQCDNVLRYKATKVSVEKE
jgi:hypothetical protein